MPNPNEIDSATQATSHGNERGEQTAEQSNAQFNEAAANDSMRPLSEQFVVVERIVGYIVAMVILAIVIPSTVPIFFLVREGRWWIVLAVLAGWLLLAGLLLFSAHMLPRLVYKNTRWQFSDQGFLIHRGVIWKHRIAVPAARVQHVDVGQGPLQRWKGLGKLTIHTAGTKNASVELDGLDHAEAIRVRDLLITQKEMQDDAH